MAAAASPQTHTEEPCAVVTVAAKQHFYKSAHPVKSPKTNQSIAPDLLSQTLAGCQDRYWGCDGAHRHCIEDPCTKGFKKLVGF